MATITLSPFETTAPAETAAQYLRQHRVRADVTRSLLTATSSTDNTRAEFEVTQGTVDMNSVRKFLGY